MVSAPDSRASSPGLGPGCGHCAVLLGKTFTLTVPLSTQVYKWVPACRHPIQGGVEILLVASCYRNLDNLRPNEPLGS